MKNLLKGFVDLRNEIEVNLLKIKVCYLELENGAKIYCTKEDKYFLKYILNNIYDDYINNLVETEEELFKYSCNRAYGRGVQFDDVKDEVIKKIKENVNYEEALQKSGSDLFKNEGNKYYFFNHKHINYIKYKSNFKDLDKIEFSFLRECVA